MSCFTGETSFEESVTANVPIKVLKNVIKNQKKHPLVLVLNYGNKDDPIGPISIPMTISIPDDGQPLYTRDMIYHLSEYKDVMKSNY